MHNGEHLKNNVDNNRSISSNRQPVLSDQDFNQFPFRIDNPTQSNQQYLDKFVAHSTINEKEVRKQMTELVYINVLQKLNKEVTGLPHAFFENQHHWCKLLIKTKTVQDIFNDFTLKISQALEKELKYNKELVEVYLKTPKPKRNNNDSSIIHQGNHNRQQMQTQRLLRSRNKSLDEQQKQGTHDQNVNNSSPTKDKANRSLTLKQRFSLSQKNKLPIIGNGADNKQEGFNQFQVEMKKVSVRIKEIDQLVCEFENNTNELAIDVQNFEKHSTLQYGLKNNFEPCQQIKELLENWNAEDISTEDDLIKFASELWLSLGDYEKELRESIKGHELVLKYKTKQFDQKITWIDQKSGMYIEALEKALSETKLKYGKELNQANMIICDMESRLMNYQQTESDLNKMIYGKIVVDSVEQAREVIEDLRRKVTVIHLENKHYEQERNYYISKNKKLIQDKKELIETNGGLNSVINYYQAILYQITKDLEVYSNNGDQVINDGNEQQENTLSDFQKFVEIESMLSNDDDSQIDVYTKLVEIQLKEKLSEKSQVFLNLNGAFKSIFTWLHKFGIVPKTKIEIPQSLKKDKQPSGSVSHINIYDKDKNQLLNLFESVNEIVAQVSNDQQQKQQKNTIKQGGIDSSKQQVKNSKDGRNLQPRLSQNLGSLQQAQNAQGSKIIKSNIVGNASKESNIDAKTAATKQSSKSFGREILSLKSGGVKQGLGLNLQKSSRSIILSEGKSKSAKKSMFRFGELKDQFEYLVEAKYRESFAEIYDQDDEDDDLRPVKLSSQQVQDLQKQIATNLQVKLTSEQTISLFKQSLPDFISATNEVIKSNTQSTQNNETVVPQKDCIKFDYDQKMQVIGFSLRPRIVEILYKKSSSQMKDLNEVIQNVIKLNQLWQSLDSPITNNKKSTTQVSQLLTIEPTECQQLEAQPSLNKQKIQITLKCEQQQSSNSINLQSNINSSNATLKPQSYDQFTQTEAQESKMIEFLRQLIAELRARCSKKSKESFKIKLSQMGLEKLVESKIEGIQNDKNQDLTILEIISFVMKTTLKKIKSMKPIQRQKFILTNFIKEYVPAIDQTQIQVNPHQNPSNQDAQMLQQQPQKQQREEHVNKFKQYLIEQSKIQEGSSRTITNRDLSFLQQLKPDSYDSYLQNSLKNEVSKTIITINEYMSLAQESYKTCHLSEENELFPLEQSSNKMLFKRYKKQNASFFQEQKMSKKKKQSFDISNSKELSTQLFSKDSTELSKLLEDQKVVPNFSRTSRNLPLINTNNNVGGSHNTAVVNLTFQSNKDKQLQIKTSSTFQSQKLQQSEQIQSTRSRKINPFASTFQNTNEQLSQSVDSIQQEISIIEQITDSQVPYGFVQNALKDQSSVEFKNRDLQLKWKQVTQPLEKFNLPRFSNKAILGSQVNKSLQQLANLSESSVNASFMKDVSVQENSQLTGKTEQTENVVSGRGIQIDDKTSSARNANIS